MDDPGKDPPLFSSRFLSLRTDFGVFTTDEAAFFRFQVGNLPLECNCEDGRTERYFPSFLPFMPVHISREPAEAAEGGCGAHSAQILSFDTAV